MNEKRIHKFATLMARRDLFGIHGPSDAPIGIVSWGSVSGVAREALALARRSGLPAKLMVPRLLYPVAQQVYEEFFASVRTGFVVEQSHQGQLYRLLRMFVELPQGMTSLSRSGSNPFTPLELMNHLRDRAIALERAAIPELETQSD
jgi:2-oxoglutarate ferredoxin oxidoreductase subunit alpha